MTSSIFVGLEFQPNRCHLAFLIINHRSTKNDYFFFNFNFLGSQLPKLAYEEKIQMPLNAFFMILFYVHK